MKFGTGFALAALPTASAVKDFAQALDGAGFDYTGAAGHTLSQPLGTHEGRPPMTYVGPFYDQFVLYSFLAGVTERIHFMSSIFILPSWPTAVVAKQAAELQFFSGGRFELGIGISWSEPEYRALGQPFRNRARRLEEQIEVLRRLWAEPFVTFAGKYHDLDNIGLNRPVEQSIPIWFGTGFDDRVLQRVARLGDGWMPMGDPTPKLPYLKQQMADAGRNPSLLMVRAGITAGDEGAGAWVEAAKRLEAAGVTHVSISAPPGLAGAAGLQRVIEARDVLAGELGAG